MRLVLYLVVLVLLVARTALADEPKVKDIPSGPDNIVVLREGDKAPFTGQLFDQSTALRWANWLQQYKLRLETDVNLQRRINVLDSQLCDEQKTIAVEKYKIVTTEYQNQVLARDMEIAELKNRADNPPFYKTFWFGATVGVIVTTGLVIAGAVLVSSAP